MAKHGLCWTTQRALSTHRRHRTTMRNTERLSKLDKRLRPLQDKYAKDAWKIASKIYDVGDHEQRRLAFATVCSVELSCSFVLAAIRPPTKRHFGDSRSKE